MTNLSGVPEHPILNFRRSVVHLGRGDGDSAEIP